MSDNNIATFVLESNTYYLDGDALVTARGCARGDYQRDLVEGNARWSGADLSGKAATFGLHYQTSRRNLVRKLRAAGRQATWLVAAHGRRVLVVSSEPCTVVVDGPFHGPRQAVVTDHPAIACGTFTPH